MIKQEDLEIIRSYLAINHEPQKSDIIFLFGQIRMSKAWKRAVELYKSGYATKILVTGGPGSIAIESGIKLSEAEIINNYYLQTISYAAMFSNI